jgi:ADP-ribose pyrophosphatase YjhB (NUDIX family)
VKNWLGNGGWSLPGGGIHGWERAEEGVVREIREETGVLVSDLEFLGEGFRKDTIGGRHYLMFYKTLVEKPEIKLRKREITGYEWVPITSVKNFGKLTPIVEIALARYASKDTV